MNLFLGTNYGHGSAAAVVSADGVLLFAVEEGRIIGRKDTSNFPDESISAALQGIEGDVVAWAEGWNLSKRLLHKGVFQTARYGLRNTTYFNHRLAKELERYFEGKKRYRTWTNKLGIGLCCVGHHLAHAFSLLPSGLPPRSLVVVSDATAEQESMSTFYWSGKEMLPVAHSDYPHSIGSFYHQLAYHLGFQGRTGPGKLMALAGYGKPLYYDALHKLCTLEGAIFKIDLNRYPAWRIDKTWLTFSKTCETSLGRELERAHQNFESGKDLAASMQKLFTEITTKYILESLQLVNDRYNQSINVVGIAGGAALNCHANGQILRRLQEQGVNELIVSPWPDDPGTAIGAAAWVAQRRIPDIEFARSNVFLGTNLPAGDLVTDDDVNSAVQVLLTGGIISLVSGRLEFGPRALGGRCILADARSLDMKTKLNSMKGRPQFMPFAPAVLQDDFSDFFEGIGSSYMSWTVVAKKKAYEVVPAAVHITGEARVQIVTDNLSLLHRVLSLYKRFAGFGLLLLTSLNGEGEAIPNSLERSTQISRRLGVNGILTDSNWTQLAVAHTNEPVC